MIRIDTERLLLRTPGPADLAGYLCYRNEASALAAQQMAASGEAEARTFLAAQAMLPEDAVGWRMLGIEEKARPGAGIVGEVGVLLRSEQPEQGDIGWWLHPEARGRGIATEAARGLLGWCFGSRNLHRVTAGCLAANARSFQVMRRLGMRVETRTIGSRKLGDAWHDEIGCALLRREWSAS